MVNRFAGMSSPTPTLQIHHFKVSMHCIEYVKATRVEILIFSTCDRVIIYRMVVVMNLKLVEVHCYNQTELAK